MGCFAADFTMNKQVRSQNRHSGGHGFYQRMRERLGISGGNEQVASLINMVQLLVRNSAKLHNVISDSEIVNQFCRGLCIVCARRLFLFQLASQK